jgi:uncharacterized membrane protein
MIIALTLVALATAAIGLTVDGLWWLLLVSLGLVIGTVVVAMMRPFGVEPPVAEPESEPPGRAGWTRRYAVFGAWTREQLLRPGIDNLDPTHRFEDAGEVEPWPRAG